MFAPAWFVSAQVGWQAANGSLQKTTDGGAHWTSQLSLAYPKLFARDMRFLDAQNGFVMPLVFTAGHGTSALYATTDGEHWVRRTVPDTSNPALGMDFVSASEGYVLVGTGAPTVPSVFHTVDGGRSWQQVATAGPTPGQLPYSVHLEGMRFLDAAHGWISATSLAGLSAGGSPGATPSYYATQTADTPGTSRTSPPRPASRIRRPARSSTRPTSRTRCTASASSRPSSPPGQRRATASSAARPSSSTGRLTAARPSRCPGSAPAARWPPPS